MDEDRWTPSVEMAWLLRYLSLDLTISVSAHRKSKVARHAAASLPAMDAKTTYDCVIRSLQAKKPPDIRRLRLDFITGKPQLDDEDTHAYLDAVQQRKTALEAAHVTFTYAERI
eukprot:scaffold11364_cov35-Prasinocladus_malaysianus.AAC.2